MPWSAACGCSNAGGLGGSSGCCVACRSCVAGYSASLTGSSGWLPVMWASGRGWPLGAPPAAGTASDRGGACAATLLPAACLLTACTTCWAMDMVAGVVGRLPWSPGLSPGRGLAAGTARRPGGCEPLGPAAAGCGSPSSRRGAACTAKSKRDWSCSTLCVMLSKCAAIFVVAATVLCMAKPCCCSTAITLGSSPTDGRDMAGTCRGWEAARAATPDTAGGGWGRP